MESQKMIDQLKSKYVVNHLFEYIPDTNFPLKIFYYSKTLKNKLDINLSYCYNKYLSSLSFDLNKYLINDGDGPEKDILAKEYDNFVSSNGLKKEKFANILYEVIADENEKEKKKKEKEKENNETSEENKDKYINVDSPLFEIVSKVKDFDNTYTIYISQKYIDNFNLKDDYLKIFQNLNNSNKSYSSIYYVFTHMSKLDYLNELNFNCNNIKKLTLHFKYDGFIECENKNNSINVLELFPNLEYLKLKGESELISILENVTFKELKVLDLSSNNITNVDFLEKVKFEKLETLNLRWNEISDLGILEKINYKYLKELEASDNMISEINSLRNVQLDKLKKLALRGNRITDISALGDVNYKELREIDLSHNRIEDIKVLENITLDKLGKLNLYGNKIDESVMLRNIDDLQFKVEI